MNRINVIFKGNPRLLPVSLQEWLRPHLMGNRVQWYRFVGFETHLSVNKVNKEKKMKRNLKFNSNSLFRFKSFTYDIGAMLLRNGQHSLVGIFLRLIPVMNGKISPVVPKMISIILGKTQRLIKTQGLFGLVKYLKACSVITQQIVSGYHVANISPRVARTNSGIPRILPLYVRKQIRNKNLFWVRLTLTIFSIFRDIQIKTKPNFKSIVAPSTCQPGMVENLKEHVAPFVMAFTGKASMRHRLEGTYPFAISSSSPQVVRALELMKVGTKVLKIFRTFSSSNPLSLMRSAMCFDAEHIASLKVILSLNNDGSFMNFFNQARNLLQVSLLGLPIEVLTKFFEFGHTYIGKLSLKQEAAGKMRVFAMVDPWTQWALYPIHKLIFDILSKHSSIDGTFDQLTPVREKLKEFAGKPVYSMDLSSATDRLPLSLQKLILQGLLSFSKEEIEAWAHLLVGRSYWEPSTKMAYKYSVGQPMGAYSSWAMLALTHHFIVQVCAWSVPGFPYGKLFADYVVLGDDIVIFNTKVAKKYHKLMLALGVECNLSKSIMSPKGLGLEFAKKTFLLGQDVSPIPLKEAYSALNSVSELVNFSHKYSLTLPQTLKFAGFGYRVLGGCNQALSKLNLKVKFIALTLVTFDAKRLSDTLTSMLTFKVNPDAFRKSVEYFVRTYVAESVVKQLSVITPSNKKTGPKQIYRSRVVSVNSYFLMMWEKLQTYSQFKFQEPYGPLLIGFQEALRLFHVTVYKSYASKISRTFQEAEGVIKLQYSELKVMSDSQKTVPNLLAILVKVLEAEKLLLSFDRKAMVGYAELVPLNKYKAPKLFDLGQLWLKVLFSLKNEFNLGLNEPIVHNSKKVVKGETFIIPDFSEPSDFRKI